MNILKRFINWIRWYFSEEGKQTRLYEKEAQKIWLDKSVRMEDDVRAERRRHLETADLVHLYPKSRQAIASKLVYDRRRPQHISHEKWERRWRDRAQRAEQTYLYAEEYRKIYIRRSFLAEDDSRARQEKNVELQNLHFKYPKSRQALENRLMFERTYMWYTPEDKAVKRVKYQTPASLTPDLPGDLVNYLTEEEWELIWEEYKRIPPWVRMTRKGWDKIWDNCFQRPTVSPDSTGHVTKERWNEIWSNCFQHRSRKVSQ